MAAPRRSNQRLPPSLFLQVSVLPGNVLTVVMSKPPGFRYKSGQYIFLKCPAISPFEW